ncbi:MAG: Na+/H+ antiporter NhaA [Phycisphaeraceae bacterium]|nr:MAG: Na+/H+ antiporter NhaA [Phycisphaeraceae bacterium]
MSMAVHPHIPPATHELEPMTGEKLVRPFARFAQLSSAGGLVLLFCTLVAMIWANSSSWQTYFEVIEAPVHIGIGDSVLMQHVAHGEAPSPINFQTFINDALMAIFFLLVGLEIKRELLVGELSDVRKAAMPIAGALGGMIAPALIFTAFNFGRESLRGWGVPMATDIAFAVGILTLLGSRVPNSIRVFLTSLAIADDLGALLVIAFFYTDHLQPVYLGYATALVLLLVLLNRFGFKSAVWFIVPGIVLWYCFYESGVHSTIAGVVLAATIPVNPRVDRKRYASYTRAALDTFEEHNDPTQDIRTSGTQRAAVMRINENGRLVLPLLHRMESAMHGWVAYLIIPLFALANAGLHLEGSFTKAVGNAVSLGVIFGLVVGKPLGITAACWLLSKAGLGKLGKGVTWRHMIGAGCLGGIGFTMALFIATLGYREHHDYLNNAKLGILLASGISAIIGLSLLLTCKPIAEPEVDEED